MGGQACSGTTRGSRCEGEKASQPDPIHPELMWHGSEIAARPPLLALVVVVEHKAVDLGRQDGAQAQWSAMRVIIHPESMGMYVQITQSDHQLAEPVHVVENG